MNSKNKKILIVIRNIHEDGVVIARNVEDEHNLKNKHKILLVLQIKISFWEIVWEKKLMKSIKDKKLIKIEKFLKELVFLLMLVFYIYIITIKML